MNQVTGHIRAAIYTRVSTLEQAKEDKTSLAEQISACKKVCIDHGWEIIGEYKDEGISGHLLEERLGLQKLLDDSRNGKLDLVVVKDFDRLARSKAKASEIREQLKIQFIQTYSLSTPVEPRNPKEYDPIDDDLGLVVEGMSDVMSEIERNKIRRRMMIAKNAIAKTGVLPNKVPFGYVIKRTLDEHGKIHRNIEVDEQNASTIKRIFQMTEAGKGKRTIALQFNQEGVKAPKSGVWTSQAIEYIVRNKTYAGFVRWGWRHANYEISKRKKERGHEGIEVKGNHIAIVDPDLFERVQKILKDRGSKYTGRAQISRGLLTGIAKCIRCGNGVTYCRRHIKNSMRNPNWKDVETAEYRCSGTMYGKVKCSQRVMSSKKLDEAVLSQLKGYINSPAMKKIIQDDANKPLDIKTTNSAAGIQKQLDRIPEMREKQQKAFERDMITMDDYSIAMGRLRETENDLRAALTKYSDSQKVEESQKVDRKKIWQAINDFDEFWGSMELLEKKQFLRTMIEKVIAGNNKVEVYFKA